MPTKRRAVLLCLLLLPFALLYGHKDKQSEPRCRGETSETCAANQVRGRVARASPSKPARVDATLRRMTGTKNRAVAFHDVSRTFTSTDSAAYQQMLHDVNDFTRVDSFSLRGSRHWELRKPDLPVWLC